MAETKTVKMVVTHGSMWDATGKLIQQGNLASVSLADLETLKHKLASEEEWALMQQRDKANARLEQLAAARAPEAPQEKEPEPAPPPDADEPDGTDPEASADEPISTPKPTKRHRR